MKDKKYIPTIKISLEAQAEVKNELESEKVVKFAIQESLSYATGYVKFLIDDGNVNSLLELCDYLDDEFEEDAFDHLLEKIY